MPTAGPSTWGVHTMNNSPCSEDMLGIGLSKLGSWLGTFSAQNSKTLNTHMVVQTDVLGECVPLAALAFVSWESKQRRVSINPFKCGMQVNGPFA